MSDSTMSCTEDPANRLVGYDSNNDTLAAEREEVKIATKSINFSLSVYCVLFLYSVSIRDTNYCKDVCDLV